MIYDEALENIKNHDKYNHTLDWGIIVKALERAKKVEELLELYQKRFSFYNFDEDKSLREIKLKEKELEEMK